MLELFELEMDDADCGAQACESSEHDNASAMLRVREMTRPASTAELRLAMDVETVLEDAPYSTQSPDTDLLARRLTRMGYTVHIRTALGGGDGGDCLRNLRHTFLCCTSAGSSQQPRLVVDPFFREQFVIAHPTPRYRAILEFLPQVYVGETPRLTQLVTFLCSEMSLAFKERCAVLPPWRQAASMMSKWQPRKSLDETVERSSGRRISVCYDRPPALSGLVGGAAAAAAVIGGSRGMQPQQYVPQRRGLDLGPKRITGFELRAAA